MSAEFSCDGKPMTQWQVVDANMAIERAFFKIKDAGLFPTDSSLQIVPNTMHIAAYNPGTNVVLANPILLGCMNDKQIESIMLHESWHSQSPNSGVTMSCVQGVVVGAFAIGALYKSARFLFPRHRYPMPARIGVSLLPSLVALHTLFGMAFANLAIREENQADMFAARVMGTGEILASTYSAANKRDFTLNSRTLEDRLQGNLWETEGYWTYGMIIDTGTALLRYGIFAPIDKHSPIEDRKAALLAYRPEKSYVETHWPFELDMK